MQDARKGRAQRLFTSYLTHEDAKDTALSVSEEVAAGGGRRWQLEVAKQTMLVAMDRKDRDRDLAMVSPKRTNTPRPHAQLRPKPSDGKLP